jgi:hypothetical protein
MIIPEIPKIDMDPTLGRGKGSVNSDISVMTSNLSVREPNITPHDGPVRLSRIIGDALKVASIIYPSTRITNSLKSWDSITKGSV